MRKNSALNCLLYIGLFFFVGIVGIDFVFAKPEYQDVDTDSYTASECKSTDFASSIQCGYSYTARTGTGDSTTGNNVAFTLIASKAGAGATLSGVAVDIDACKLERKNACTSDLTFSGHKSFNKKLYFGNGTSLSKCPDVYVKVNGSKVELKTSGESNEKAKLETKSAVCDKIYSQYSQEKLDKLHENTINNIQTSTSDDENIRKISNDTYRGNEIVDNNESKKVKYDDGVAKPEYVIGSLTCESLAAITEYASKLYRWVEIFMVVGLVVLTMMDYVKAITSSEAEYMKKANKRVVTRVIIIIIVFLLPVLINMVLDLFLPNIETCLNF